MNNAKNRSPARSGLCLLLGLALSACTSLEEKLESFEKGVEERRQERYAEELWKYPKAAGAVYCQNIAAGAQPGARSRNVIHWTLAEGAKDPNDPSAPAVKWAPDELPEVEADSDTAIDFTSSVRRHDPWCD